MTAAVPAVFFVLLLPGLCLVPGDLAMVQIFKSLDDKKTERSGYNMPKSDL